MKLKLRHSARLEMHFCMVSFFTGIKIFRFWPKTMDYSLIEIEVIVYSPFTGVAFKT